MENVTGPLSVADLARYLSAPRSLAEIAADGVHYQLPATRSGIGGHTTDPQHAALAIAAEQGRVLRGGKAGQASVRVLTALARRGYLQLVAHPGSRRSNWSHGVITPAGRRELARLDAEQARRVEQESRLARALTPATTPSTAADPFAMCRDHQAELFDRIDAAFAVSS